EVPPCAAASSRSSTSTRRPPTRRYAPPPCSTSARSAGSRSRRGRTRRRSRRRSRRSRPRRGASSTPWRPTRRPRTARSRRPRRGRARPGATGRSATPPARPATETLLPLGRDGPAALLVHLVGGQAQVALRRDLLRGERREALGQRRLVVPARGDEVEHGRELLVGELRPRGHDPVVGLARYLDLALQPVEDDVDQVGAALLGRQQLRHVAGERRERAGDPLAVRLVAGRAVRLEQRLALVL